MIAFTPRATAAARARWRLRDHARRRAPTSASAAKGFVSVMPAQTIATNAGSTRPDWSPHTPASATRRSCGSVRAGASMTIASTLTSPAARLMPIGRRPIATQAQQLHRVKLDRASARSTAEAKRLPTRGPSRGRSPSRPSLPTLTRHRTPDACAADGTGRSPASPYTLVDT
jgi:hypothetical protein